MKHSCDVVRDLLPLYVEKMTSEMSNIMVEEHLQECSECKKYEQSLKEDSINQKSINQESINQQMIEKTPLQVVKKDIRKRKRNAVALCSLIVALFLILLFSHLTKPRYLSLQESGISVEVTQNENCYLNFSNNVTACKMTRETWEDGSNVVTVEAWTSMWDDILGKSTPSLVMKNEDSTPDLIYYCSNKMEDGTDNMSLIYGKNPYPDGGVVTLPRLVMGIYFSICCVLLVLCGILWFVFRRKDKINKIFEKIFYIPMSYLLAHLFLEIEFSSFTAQRDFVMILIVGAIIYGICIMGSAIMKQSKKDRQIEVY